MATLFRLRVPTGWLPLPVGAHEIGRSAHCQVILDGAKVSRLHARILVDAKGASIEDLGSANGVFVNGRRVSRGRQALALGDRIVIGDFELELSSGEVAVPAPGAQQPSSRPTLLDTTVPGGATTKAHALELLGNVAERAINAGDAGRAETILAIRLREVLEAAAAGTCDAVSRELALKYASLLARSLGGSKWMEYSFDLLSATRTLPSAAELELLEKSAEATNRVDPRQVQDYIALVRGMPSSIEKVRAIGRLESILAIVCGRG